MKCNDVVRSLMKKEGVTYQDMQQALGYKTVSGVSERLRPNTANNMRVDVLVKMLDYLGYDLIIRRRKVDVIEENGRQIATFPEWTVDNPEKEAPNG